MDDEGTCWLGLAAYTPHPNETGSTFPEVSYPGYERRPIDPVHPPKVLMWDFPQGVSAPEIAALVYCDAPVGGRILRWEPHPKPW
jgi:hypothetical protein